MPQDAAEVAWWVDKAGMPHRAAAIAHSRAEIATMPQDAAAIWAMAGGIEEGNPGIAFQGSSLPVMGAHGLADAVLSQRVPVRRSVPAISGVMDSSPASQRGDG